MIIKITIAIPVFPLYVFFQQLYSWILISYALVGLTCTAQSEVDVN